jgi:hypothetical protein
VRAVYLVPSDRVVENGYRLGLERAMRQIQVFYRRELGGSTFTLHDPIVEVVPLLRPTSWYQSDAPDPDPTFRFWNAVTADAFALTGAFFNDPDNRWLFFIDADPLCGQIVGGTSGVAVLPKNDGRNMLCEGRIPACPNDNDINGVCVAVGGIAHELGHTFNLDHPTPGSCPPPDTSCGQALMWSGFAAFPNAYLTPGERQSLLTSPATSAFFTLVDPGPVPYSCTDPCPPGRPPGLTATPGSVRVALGWGPATGAASYVVRRRTGGSGAFDVVASGLGALAYVDEAVESGRTYSYLVNGANAHGEGPNSNIASAVPLGPAVTSLVPNGGPTTGGTVVNVGGSGFAAPASVTWDGLPAPSVTVVNSTLIVATTPPHARGIVDVVVSLPLGQSAARPSGYFYHPPFTPASFHTLDPCRLVDTRNPIGPRGGPALPGLTRRNFDLAGACGVPPTARGLSVNATVTLPSAPGFVTLFPGDALLPPTSTLNFASGQTRAANAAVPLSTDGTGVLAVFNGSSGAAHFILDVNGYFE